MGVSLPIPYRGASLLKHTYSSNFLNYETTEAVKSKTDIYRYGVETTTLSEIELRSTAQTTTVITHMETRVVNNAKDFPRTDLPVTTFICDSSSTRTVEPLTSITRPR
jgi:hypothetical protein